MIVNNGYFMKTQINNEQTAKILGVTVQTLELWMKQKYGPRPTWTGNIVRFDKAEVEAFARKLLPKEKHKGDH